MNSGNKRLINLDLLRLVSALLVVLFHYGFRMEKTGEGGGVAFPEIASLAMWSDAGLLVFFAISGYVIAQSAEGRSAADFAVGRLARLWPSFIVCATLTAVVLSFWPVSGLAEPTFVQWLAHLVIASRALGQPFLDGAYWTIVYEIVFYGWVFLLVATKRFESGWRVAVAGWLALSILNEAFVGSGAIRKLFITEYAGYFAFGLVLYKLRDDTRIGTSLLFLAAAFWSGMTPHLIEPLFANAYNVERNLIGLSLVGPLVLTSVMLAVGLPALPVPRHVALALGGLTYPLYLLHQNIGYAAFTRFGDAYNRFPTLALLITVLILISWLVMHVVEPRGRSAVHRAASSALSSWSSLGLVGRVRQ